jgi:acetyl esterase/lipase
MASPQFQALYRTMQAQPDRSALPVAELRAAGLRKAEGFPLPADVTCRPVDAGGVPGEWIVAPGAGSGRALLYLHGGGYYRGSIATVRELCARISRAAALPVLAVDYRLAPEHRFPAALEDARAAWRWLRAQGHAGSALAVGGDSAGGGLAVALLVALRDAGEALPAAGVCLSPWVDLTHGGASLDELAAHDPQLTRAYLERFAALYLAGADPRDPGASPLFADLAGLPPLLVQVGGRELLRDDGVRLAERASAADVPVELDLWEEMTHVWQNNGAELPEGQQAVERIGAFLRARVG